MFRWIRNFVGSLRLPSRIEEPLPEPASVTTEPFVWPREKWPPFGKNAPGDFYVEDGCCVSCEAPFTSAPDLIEHDERTLHCYFKKQPESPAELEQAVAACIVSCVEAVRYRGNDPTILSRFIKLRQEHCCDALSRRR